MEAQAFCFVSQFSPLPPHTRGRQEWAGGPFCLAVTPWWGGRSLGKAWSQSTGCSECVIRFPGCSSSTFRLRGSWLLPFPEMFSGACSQGMTPACLSPRLEAS